jgi:ATPase subunit of ABC transporter with duplicated ATPase domains
LEWDQAKKAHFRFFLSCDGKTKTIIWLTQPTSDLATINYKRGEKKRKDRQEKEKEEENCAQDQESAQNHGYCCHQHAKVAKKEHERYKKQVSRQMEKTKEIINEEEQCVHCDEDPCVFTQIEMRPCKNDEIYYNVGGYEKALTTYNSKSRFVPSNSK